MFSEFSLRTSSNIYLRLRHKNRVCVLASAILESCVLLRREVLSAAVVKKRRSGHLQLPKMAVLQDVQKPHFRCVIKESTTKGLNDLRSYRACL